MRIIGCDLHARQQTIAMLDTDTGELEEKTLEHEGETVREFYSALRGPILVGIEATGSMQWFLELMEELGIECRVGHPAKIRKAETRKQKHDRRDARLLLTLLKQRDVRSLILYRHPVGAHPEPACRTPCKRDRPQPGIAARLFAHPCEPHAPPLSHHRKTQRRVAAFLSAQAGAERAGEGESSSRTRKLGIRLWILLRDRADRVARSSVAAVGCDRSTVVPACGNACSILT